MQSTYDRKTIDRFWSKIDKTDGCWNWTGKKTPKGHPIFTIGAQGFPAQRISFELNKGAIPENMVVVRTCGSKTCVHPEHLDLKPDPKAKTAEQRFWEKVDRLGDCWLWTGKKRSGRAAFYLDGGFIEAHYFAYQTCVDELPKNGFILRSCDNPICVNPDHLYVSRDPQGRTVEERFWSKVDKTENCWNWTGKRSTREICGYGLFSYEGKFVSAHRAAYMMKYGEIPQNMVIAHRCDNPLCVRLDHLFLATQAENVQDMFAKGRDNHVKGERVNTAKLTAEQVAEIRRLHRLGESASALARKHGVTSAAVDAIVHRRSWKHVA